MKHLFILFTLHIFITPVFSQPAVSSGSPTLTFAKRRPDTKKVLDTASFVVTYIYKHIRDTQQKKIWKDQYALEIGKKYSRFYSIFAEKSDSILYIFSESKAAKKIDAGVNPHKFLRPDECINYDNYLFSDEDHQLLVTNVIVNRLYGYMEKLPPFVWEIMPDTLVLFDYSCQLAKTSFRGRNYVAWFCPEITITKGPWKFFGLPGLILKVETDDSDFCFEAISIQVPKTIHPIYRHTNGYEKITHGEMLKLYRKSYEDPAGLVIQHGWLYSGTDTHGVYRQLQSGEKIFPYVPFLELE